MRNLVYIFLSLFLLSACFKEEDPRAAFINYETIALEDDYDRQIFYSLYDNSEVSNNSYTEWNLAFYSGTDLSYIRLNAAANMWVIKPNSSNFNDSYGSVYNQDEKRFDGSFGRTNNLALDITTPGFSADTLFTQGEVYLIHPGIDANGNELGNYKKFVFEGIYLDSYLIRYANLDGSNEQRRAIPKNENINFVSFSFSKNSIVNIEPPKVQWDILFSRYTDTVYTIDGAEFLPGYAVTGAYLNENGVEAYLEESIVYEDFNASDIRLDLFSSKKNTIGHTWKQFSEQYFILDNKSYIIKDRDGRYFKLRFLSFYDSITGNKGYPSFEFELL
ncbi:HmuY family protein [Chitinophagales bacterium]|nr:HmuY family protein [Chitinophagales bacterium]